jgi:hypothetical protein
MTCIDFYDACGKGGASAIAEGGRGSPAISTVVLHTSPGLEMRNSTESSFLPSGLTISSRVKARVHSFGIESREIRIETQKLQTLSLSQRQVLHHRDVLSYIRLGRALYNNSGPYTLHTAAAGHAVVYICSSPGAGHIYLPTGILSFFHPLGSYTRPPVMQAHYIADGFAGKAVAPL